MNGTQKAIIPAIILISILLLFLNRLVNPLSDALAATEVVQEAESAGELIQEESDVVNSTEEGTCEHEEDYPIQVATWCNLIETTSEEYGIDPLLTAAVMLVESGGQPEVISRSGAVGLMQVMPRDGIAASFQCVNGPCFSNRPTIEELKDPYFNVEYGVRMLAGLQIKHGNYRDALMAYGPADVGYWYADLVLETYRSFTND